MKEKTRPGVMIYFEDFEAVSEDMNDEQIGRFIRAIIAYAKDGEYPDFSNEPLMKVPFRIIKPKIDRDGERYEQQKIHGQYMAYVKKAKASGYVPLDEESWKLSVTNSCEQLSDSYYPAPPIDVSVSIPVTTPVSVSGNPYGRELTDGEKELLAIAERGRKAYPHFN